MINTDQYYNKDKTILTIPDDVLVNQHILIRQSLRELTFNAFFNQELKEQMLPMLLTHLRFGHNYNREIQIYVLPRFLTHLFFGYCYNQKINENVLPQQLIHLRFGWMYNQVIQENVLPKSLTYLELGFYYKQIIENNVLPKSLTTIKLYGSSHNKKTIDILPNSNIKTIIFEDLQTNVDNLPMTIETIKLLKYGKYTLKIIKKITLWLYCC